MPYAVTLPLDDAAAADVQRMLAALADQAVADDVVRLGYRPHVTLAIMPDTAPVAEVEKATFNVAARWASFSMTLAGLGVFPGTPAVIWAAPIVTAMLLTKHAELHLALTPFGVHEHYAPGAWVPHVTLTKEGSVSAARAIEAAASAWRGSIGTTIERVELVRFRPVNVLRSEALQ
jgi:2'-5' RNA ligase